MHAFWLHLPAAAAKHRAPSASLHSSATLQDEQHLQLLAAGAGIIHVQYTSIQLHCVLSQLCATAVSRVSHSASVLQMNCLDLAVSGTWGQQRIEHSLWTDHAALVAKSLIQNRFGTAC